jgi:small subunit ribosomal protein S16
MLAIRMQRTGRKGHAMFRMVVQDSRRTPSSGKIVAALGSYDPHAKTVNLDKEKAAFYLEHGARPSDRATRLLKNEGLKLPSWVSLTSDKKRDVRHPDKRRSTTPAAPEVEVKEEKTTTEATTVEDAEAVAPEVTEEVTEKASETKEEETTSDADAKDAPSAES